jgi:hypothetical protein
VVALLGLGDHGGAEAVERAVDKEDLHRDIGLDVGLAEEREDLAAGRLFDRLLWPCVAITLVCPAGGPEALARSVDSPAARQLARAAARPQAHHGA